MGFRKEELSKVILRDTGAGAYIDGRSTPKRTLPNGVFCLLFKLYPKLLIFFV